MQAFPKTDLNGNFIGDTYPLCTDFPDQHFLMKGAKFRLMGDSSGEPKHFDRPDASPRLTPSQSDSELFDQLCAADNAGTCQFAAEVTRALSPVFVSNSFRLPGDWQVVLSENLNCDGDECEVDTLSVVKMVNGDQVPSACCAAGYLTPRSCR